MSLRTLAGKYRKDYLCTTMDKMTKIVNEIRWTDGQNVRRRLEDITHNPMRSQEEFLMRLVRENAKTEYGRKNNFKNIRNMDDFRRYVPLTSYDDYTSYIERLANGERNILTAYLTEHISIWDYFKGLPQSRWGVQTCYDYCFCTAFYIVGHHGYLTDGLTLNLLNEPIERLASGVTVGNLLDRMLLIRDTDYKGVYVIPFSAINTANESTKTYIEALYALKERNISLAICDRYDKMVEMLRYIEKNWLWLTDEIEKGSTHVKSDVKRANEIRKIMETHHIGTQLVEQLWPGLRCIMVHDAHNLSASFELLRTYCGSNVHFVFTGIGSAAGTFSTTLNIDDPQTVLIPDSVFYEFKPKEAENYDTLLTLDQLEIGHSYELVATTLSGLYRYKTQKSIVVVGHHHDTPTVIIDNG